LEFQALSVSFRARLRHEHMQVFRLHLCHPDQSWRDAMAAHVAFEFALGGMAVAEFASDLPPVLAQDVDGCLHEKFSLISATQFRIIRAVV